jgi:cytochrome P450
MRHALGSSITVEQLEENPHQILAELRTHEPVSWIDALEAWLVTRYDLVVAAMRDPATFTVADPRFSTAQVIGPSMLSLDGEPHALHRAAFAPPFRPRAVADRFTEAVRAYADALIDDLEDRGAAEMRRDFAGPLAAGTLARSLGLPPSEVGSLLVSYDSIVAAVTEITAGEGSGTQGTSAFEALSACLQEAIDRENDSLLAVAARHSNLTLKQVISNAGVLLFGGIETTEGMIASALLQLLAYGPALDAARQHDRALDAVIEESLRLEPAAAVVDRYATANIRFGDSLIRQGDLVRLSIAAANRDPAVFADPDRFNPERPNVRRHLAFAHGPHVCVGVHLARLEARIGLRRVLDRLPGIRLDPAHTAEVRGLVFRKPQALHVLWDTPVRDHAGRATAVRDYARRAGRTKESQWP